MKSLGLFILLLHFFFTFTATQGQLVSEVSTAPLAHTSSSPFNMTDIDGFTPSPSAFNISTVPSNTRNMTVFINSSAAAPASYYSPSPTSFIFTYYPTHTAGLNTSTASSARPSQSAPLPDDTIGKYGRLHISNRSHHLPIPLSFFLFVSFISLFYHCCDIFFF